MSTINNGNGGQGGIPALASLIDLVGASTKTEDFVGMRTEKGGSAISTMPQKSAPVSSEIFVPKGTTTANSTSGISTPTTTTTTPAKTSTYQAPKIEPVKTISEKLKSNEVTAEDVNDLYTLGNTDSTDRLSNIGKVAGLAGKALGTQAVATVNESKSIIPNLVSGINALQAGAKEDTANAKASDLVDAGASGTGYESLSARTSEQKQDLLAKAKEDRQTAIEWANKAQSDDWNAWSENIKKWSDSSKAEIEAENLTGASKFFVDLGYSAGQMVPSMAAGAAATALTGGIFGTAAVAASTALKAVPQVASLSTMWVNVYNNTYNELYSDKQNNYDIVDIARKSALDACVEVASETIIGGTPYVSDGLLDPMLDKVSAGLANSAITRMLVNPTRLQIAAKNLSVATAAIGKFLISPAGEVVRDIVGEGVEEMFSTAVSPIIDRYTINPDAQNATASEYFESFMSGAVLGGVFQAVPAVFKSAATKLSTISVDPMSGRISTEAQTAPLTPGQVSANMDAEIYYINKLVAEGLTSNEAANVGVQSGIDISIDQDLMPEPFVRTAATTQADVDEYVRSKVMPAVEKTIQRRAGLVNANSFVGNATNTVPKIEITPSMITDEAVAKYRETHKEAKKWKRDSTVRKHIVEELNAQAPTATAEKWAELTQGVVDGLKVFNDLVKSGADITSIYGKDAAAMLLQQSKDFARYSSESGLAFYTDENGRIFNRDEYVANVVGENPTKADIEKANKEFIAKVNIQKAARYENVNNLIKDIKQGLSQFGLSSDMMNEDMQAAHPYDPTWLETKTLSDGTKQSTLYFNPNLVRSEAAAISGVAHEIVHFAKIKNAALDLHQSVVDLAGKLDLSYSDIHKEVGQIYAGEDAATIQDETDTRILGYILADGNLMTEMATDAEMIQTLGGIDQFIEASIRDLPDSPYTRAVLQVKADVVSSLNGTYVAKEAARAADVDIPEDLERAASIEPETETQPVKSASSTQSVKAQEVLKSKSETQAEAKKAPAKPTSNKGPAWSEAVIFKNLTGEFAVLNGLYGVRYSTNPTWDVIELTDANGNHLGKPNHNHIEILKELGFEVYKNGKYFNWNITGMNFKTKVAAHDTVAEWKRLTGRDALPTEAFAPTTSETKTATPEAEVAKVAEQAAEYTAEDKKAAEAPADGESKKRTVKTKSDKIPKFIQEKWIPCVQNGNQNLDIAVVEIDDQLTIIEQDHEKKANARKEVPFTTDLYEDLTGIRLGIDDKGRFINEIFNEKHKKTGNGISEIATKDGFKLDDTVSIISPAYDLIDPTGLLKGFKMRFDFGKGNIELVKPEGNKTLTPQQKKVLAGFKFKTGFIDEEGITHRGVPGRYVYRGSDAASVWVKLGGPQLTLDIYNASYVRVPVDTNAELTDARLAEMRNKIAEREQQSRLDNIESVAFPQIPYTVDNTILFESTIAERTYSRDNTAQAYEGIQLKKQDGSKFNKTEKSVLNKLNFHVDEDGRTATHDFNTELWSAIISNNAEVLMPIGMEDTPYKRYDFAPADFADFGEFGMKGIDIEFVPTTSGSTEGIAACIVSNFRDISRVKRRISKDKYFTLKQALCGLGSTAARELGIGSAHFGNLGVASKHVVIDGVDTGFTYGDLRQGLGFSYNYDTGRFEKFYPNDAVGQRELLNDIRAWIPSQPTLTPTDILEDNAKLQKAAAANLFADWTEANGVGYENMAFKVDVRNAEILLKNTKTGTIYKAKYSPELVSKVSGVDELSDIFAEKEKEKAKAREAHRAAVAESELAEEQAELLGRALAEEDKPLSLDELKKTATSSKVIFVKYKNSPGWMDYSKTLYSEIVEGDIYDEGEVDDIEMVLDGETYETLYDYKHPERTVPASKVSVVQEHGESITSSYEKSVEAKAKARAAEEAKAAKEFAKDEKKSKGPAKKDFEEIDNDLVGVSDEDLADDESFVKKAYSRVDAISYLLNQVDFGEAKAASEAKYYVLIFPNAKDISDESVARYRNTHLTKAQSERLSDSNIREMIAAEQNVNDDEVKQFRSEHNVKSYADRSDLSIKVEISREKINYVQEILERVKQPDRIGGKHVEPTESMKESARRAMESLRSGEVSGPSIGSPNEMTEAEMQARSRLEGAPAVPDADAAEYLRKLRNPEEVVDSGMSDITGSPVKLSLVGDTIGYYDARYALDNPENNPRTRGRWGEGFYGDITNKYQYGNISERYQYVSNETEGGKDKFLYSNSGSVVDAPDANAAVVRMYGNNTLTPQTRLLGADAQTLLQETHRFIVDNVGQNTVTPQFIADPKFMDYARSGQALLMGEINRFARFIANMASGNLELSGIDSQYREYIVQRLGFDSVNTGKQVVVYDESQVRTSKGQAFRLAQKSITNAEVDNLINQFDKAGVNLNDAISQEEIDRQYADLQQKYGTYESGIPKKASSEKEEYVSKSADTLSKKLQAEAQSSMDENLRRQVLAGQTSVIPLHDTEVINEVHNWLNRSGIAVKDVNGVPTYDMAKAFAELQKTYGEKITDEPGIVKLEQLILDLGAQYENGRGNISPEISVLGSQMSLMYINSASNAGRLLRAMGLIKKLTPYGRTVAIQSEIEALRDNFKERYGNRKSILKGSYDKIANSLDGIENDETYQGYLKELQNAKTGAEIEEIEEAIKNYIASKIPPTLDMRIEAWRFLAMLGNARTVIRNFAGNIGSSVETIAKDITGGFIEDIYYSGKDKQGERTKSFKNRAKVGGPEYQFAKQYYENIKGNLTGTSKYSMEADITRRINKWGNGPVGKFLNAWQNATNWAMESDKIGDQAFMKFHYTRALANYIAAQGWTTEYLTSNTRKANLDLAKASDYATNQALEATFRGASKAADILNSIENDSKYPVLMKLLVGGIIPFKKTPINMLKFAVDYSPLGLVSGVFKASTRVGSLVDKNGKLATNPKAKGVHTYTAAEAINDISKGLTGTGAFIVGVLAAGLGAIKSTGDDDNYIENYDKMLGYQEYSVTIGGKNFTIDWLTPTSIPFLSGVSFATRMGNNDSAIPNLETLFSIVGNMADPITNLSVLSGVSDMLEYDSSLGDIAITAAEGYASQFIPTLAGQVARSLDSTRRDAYNVPDETGTVLGKEGEIFKNKLAAKIPGLSQNVEPYVDLWGRQETNSGLLEQLFSPSYVREVNVTAVDDRLTDIFEESGRNAYLLPRKPDKSITLDKKTYSYTASEYTEAKKTVGQESYNGLDEAFRTPAFDTLSLEDQSEVISNIYGYAKKVAKYDYAERNGIDIPEKGDYKTYLELQDAVSAGKTTVGRYYTLKQALKSFESRSDKMRYLRNAGITSVSDMKLYL